MDSFSDALLAIAANPVPEQAWEELTALLDQHPEVDLGEAEKIIGKWDYLAVLRQPSESTWQGLQTGAPVPNWWPLVRHLTLGKYDRLDHLPTDRIRSLRVSSEVEWDGSMLPYLPALATLDLTGCDVDCRSLVAARRLQTLTLRRSTVVNPSALCKLRDLQDLDVSETDVPLQSLGNCSHLRRLDCSHNHLPDLEPLTNMAQLEVLVAEHCTGRPDSEPFGRCPSLRRVLLAGTSIDLTVLDMAVRQRIVFEHEEV